MIIMNGNIIDILPILNLTQCEPRVAPLKADTGEWARVRRLLLEMDAAGRFVTALPRAFAVGTGGGTADCEWHYVVSGQVHGPFSSGTVFILTEAFV